MLSVELNNLATILDDARLAPDVSAQAKQWSQRIKQGIHEYGVRFNIMLEKHKTDVADSRFPTTYLHTRPTVG
jgi:meiotically up-regulated gene 157 (Mug157) protein